VVYKIIWTLRALDSYVSNMRYLEEFWTEKEISKFASLVEKKLLLLSRHPELGSSRNKRHSNVRHTVIHKRVSLIYRVRPQKKQIELLLFWNTYQNPARLKIK